MSLPPEERQAVQESRDHWEKDICVPLREGDSVVLDLLRWKSDRRGVQISPNDCALCKKHLGFSRWATCRGNQTNSPCPLYLRGKMCGALGSPYLKFRNEPTLQNAEAMRDALQEILDEGGEGDVRKT
jgi:hypothetical protein